MFVCLFVCLFVCCSFVCLFVCLFASSAAPALQHAHLAAHSPCNNTRAAITALRIGRPTLLGSAGGAIGGAVASGRGRRALLRAHIAPSQHASNMHRAPCTVATPHAAARPRAAVVCWCSRAVQSDACARAVRVVCCTAQHRTLNAHLALRCGACRTHVAQAGYSRSPGRVLT